MASIRYSETPVEIGMVRYVGVDGGNEVAAHVVTELLGTVPYYDPEERRHFTSYVYTVRRATEAEEALHTAAYLLI